MEPALQDFERKFKVDQFLIAHVAGWRVSLRTSQTTLGAVVVSSRNGTPRMEMLDDEAQASLGTVLAACDRALRQTYGCQLVNYLALMLVDPIVHFHVIPRYNGPVERFGLKWVDADWPKPPTLGDSNQAPEGVLGAVASELKQSFITALKTDRR